MAGKTLAGFARDGLAFASQKRFLAVQVSFYALACLAFLLAVAAVAAGFLKKIFSGNFSQALSSVGPAIGLLVLATVFLAVVFWLASLWLTLFFLNAAKLFLSKAKRQADWARECAEAANRRFLPFLFATLVMAVVQGVGAFFFALLGLAGGLAAVSLLLSALYGLFFSLAFLYAPLFLALGGKGVWGSLSQSWAAFEKNPLRVFFLFLASQIAAVGGILVALVPASLAFVLGVSALLAGGFGGASIAAASVFFVLAGLALAAGVSFGNLAAIGVLASSFLDAKK